MSARLLRLCVACLLVGCGTDEPPDDDGASRSIQLVGGQAVCDSCASVRLVLTGPGIVSVDEATFVTSDMARTSVAARIALSREPGASGEDVRGVRLPALTDEQWNALTAVGTARAPTLVFARGTDRLTERSQSQLDELAGGRAQELGGRGELGEDAAHVQDGDAVEAYPFEELRPEHDAPSYVVTRDRWLLKPPRLD